VGRAINSARRQRHACEIAVYTDTEGLGAAEAKNRALAMVHTEWFALLDSDDTLGPGHVEACWTAHEDADVVYPGFTVCRKGELRQDLDPLYLNGQPAFGQPFDAGALRASNYVPTTVLARTELVKSVGGFAPHRNYREGIDASTCDDWELWLRLLDVGARFVHVPIRTWIWNWHGPANKSYPAGNTSGFNFREVAQRA
jgi:glycosyl transferase family 2